MRLLEKLKPSADLLESSGVSDPLIDAELLVLHASGLDRLSAYRDNPEIDRLQKAKINRLLKRRAKGEPLQYIIGHIDFLDLKIKVGKEVLIPRPETELLVQEAIKTVRGKELGGTSNNINASRLTSHALLNILDLCTGSGCIALAIAKELPDAKVYASDISATAIKYAKKNAVINKIKNVKFLKGSLFEPIRKPILFDLIISNPPYIRTSDISGLQREIKEWEPVGALDGGEDGLDFYRRIFSEAGSYLKKSGKIMVEVGFDQAKDVARVATGYGFRKIEIIKDYSGIERILKAGL
ncbi:MAG: protein-(glutamine-N5) methyltransferase, release factor-specific [Nitrospirae bacterium GWC2_42_7]|nr:MAG: protein-(glutamine-N5) methyltransferase, release factor-specific [Nitrospirae bacterium GWC2_42_7]